jgi:hypothetical protein
MQGWLECKKEPKRSVGEAMKRDLAGKVGKEKNKEGHKEQRKERSKEGEREHEIVGPQKDQ